MIRHAVRLLCVAGILGLAAGVVAQSGAPAPSPSQPAPVPTDQGGKAEGTAKPSQTPSTLPPSLLQSIEQLQKSWSTQLGEVLNRVNKEGASSQEPLTFIVSKELKNYQVSYRFPGDLQATVFYPRADGGDGKVVLQPHQNIFLVQFTSCGDKIPCGGPASGGTMATSDGDCPETHIITDATAGPDPCTVDLVFVRDLYVEDKEGNQYWRPAFVITGTGFYVSEELIVKSRDVSKNGRDFPTFVINKLTLQQYFEDESVEQIASRSYAAPGSSDPQAMSLITGWATVRDFEFERYPPDTSCRPYAQSSEKLVVSRPNYKPVKLGKDNGITLYPPKVFDVFTLRQMLASTAAQLAGLTGFNQASINSAFGNLQGVTTDTSYLAAQVTTVATPTVVSQAVNGTTGSNVLGSTAGTTGLNTTSNSTLTCPAGTLPGIGTSGLPACVLVATAASGTGGNPVGFTGAGNVNGGVSTLNGATGSNGTTTSNSNSNTQNTNQQNTTTTSSGGQAGTIAAIPVSSVPTAPTNIGVSSQDILAEQVQLNSQITTLRMALQGALSDQYLVAAGKTLGNRQQTTLGINISLDPQPRYKHAVAEVRIWVYAMGGKPVSIVNLLPTAKTYNVAKITSNQKAFGAGVVIDPVNVGAAGGKTKNRLYLAKDTDTVAVEYQADRDKGKLDDWPNGAEPVRRSIQEHIRDAVYQAKIWQSIGDACADNPGPLPGNRSKQANPVIFGWQFRPVLGAEYVQSGMRQVFAQLALPGTPSQGQLWAPKVYIQTRWREYDEKRQVVGTVYRDSCSIVENTDPITVASPLKVKKVFVDDMGGGIVKVKAEGTFYASGFTAMSGPNTLSPTTFDGASIQFFTSASNLMMTDDLKLVSEDGVTTELGVRPNKDQNCGIDTARLSAIPRPDGNSWVEMQVTAGNNYRIDPDGPLHPLVLVGAQVYGLHETPFLEDARDACGLTPVVCTYHFIAPTSVLRTAQTYTFRDLSWTNMKKGGRIDFDPSFNGLTVLGPDSSSSGSDAAQATGKVPPVYALSGTDFTKLATGTNWNCETSSCLEVFQGFSPLTLTKEDFEVTSPTSAILRFGPQASSPRIGLQAVGGVQKVVLSVPPPPAGAPPAPPAQPLLLFTTDDSRPSLSSNYEITPPTTVYAGPPGIDTSPFQDHATTTVKAIAIGVEQMPSEMAVAKFYRNGTSVLPVYTQASSPSSFKFYRFVWHSGVANASTVEWDLSVPADTSKGGVIASGVLNAGDSTQIEFSGVNALPNSAMTPITFTYDNILVPNALFSYDATKKTLKLMITTTMTAKPGHKEIVMNAYVKGTDGTAKATQILLPFDVTKR
jgi:hypothetical protein